MNKDLILILILILIVVDAIAVHGSMVAMH
jgi:flagellar basal body-associated protein FliL